MAQIYNFIIIQIQNYLNYNHYFSFSYKSTESKYQYLVLSADSFFL